MRPARYVGVHCGRLIGGGGGKPEVPMASGCRPIWEPVLFAKPAAAGFPAELAVVAAFVV